MYRILSSETRTQNLSAFSAILSSNMAIESSFHDVLLKVVLFVVVQALVYLILSGSSNIFSKRPRRSNSLRPARSVSIRRMLALLADMPAGGESSPTPEDLKKKQSQPDPADFTSTS